MTKFLLALLVLAVSLSDPKAALADSWTFTIAGSNFTSNLNLTGTEVVGEVTGPSGPVIAYLITSVSGTFTDPTATYAFAATAPVPANAGANAINLTDNDGYLYDNLLYPTLSGNQILDWGGLLIDDNGFYLNLFGGAFGGSDGLNAPVNSYFYFADNNYYSDNPITGKGDEIGGPANASLVATPEPESLLLLGTGLLVLSFVILKRAGKSSFNQVLRS